MNKKIVTLNFCMFYHSFSAVRRGKHHAADVWNCMVSALVQLHRKFVLRAGSKCTNREVLYMDHGGIYGAAQGGEND